MGLKCPLALWFSRYREDLANTRDEEKLQTRAMISKQARTLFKNWILIPMLPENEAARKTKEAIQSECNAIFKAVARTQSAYCSVDILEKNNDESFNLIEIKSSTKLNNSNIHYIISSAFQKYIFEIAGYQINKCLLMLVNNEYIRQGKISTSEFLKEIDVTHNISEHLHEIELNIKGITDLISDPKNPPKCTIGVKCDNYYECSFKNECWKDIPSYSIFNVFKRKNKQKAEELYAKTGSANLKDHDLSIYPKEEIENIRCHLDQKEIKSTTRIKDFLDKLVYPLYYLDYETINPAVPIFHGTYPYMQIPFQFSLHIQWKKDREPEHISFIHQELSNPMPEFIKALIESCDKSGSIIVYNKAFEESVNKSLAEIFPKYESDIFAINARMIDLMNPFKNRALYSYKQEGSVSIKKILPAFTELSYKDLEITNGQEASKRYKAFIDGRLTPDEQKKLFEDLILYCRLDTYAMVSLVKALETRLVD